MRWRAPYNKPRMLSLSKAPQLSSLSSSTTASTLSCIRLIQCPGSLIIIGSERVMFFILARHLSTRELYKETRVWPHPFGFYRWQGTWSTQNFRNILWKSGAEVSERHSCSNQRLAGPREGEEASGCVEQCWDQGGFGEVRDYYTRKVMWCCVP